MACLRIVHTGDGLVDTRHQDREFVIQEGHKLWAPVCSDSFHKLIGVLPQKNCSSEVDVGELEQRKKQGSLVGLPIIT